MTNLSAVWLFGGVSIGDILWLLFKSSRNPLIIERMPLLAKKRGYLVCMMSEPRLNYCFSKAQSS